MYGQTKASTSQVEESDSDVASTSQVDVQQPHRYDVGFVYASFNAGQIALQQSIAQRVYNQHKVKDCSKSVIEDDDFDDYVNLDKMLKPSFNIFDVFQPFQYLTCKNQMTNFDKSPWKCSYNLFFSHGLFQNISPSVYTLFPNHMSQYFVLQNVNQTDLNHFINVSIENSVFEAPTLNNQDGIESNMVMAQELNSSHIDQQLKTEIHVLTNGNQILITGSANLHPPLVNPPLPNVLGLVGYPLDNLAPLPIIQSHKLIFTAVDKQFTIKMDKLIFDLGKSHRLADLLEVTNVLKIVKSYRLHGLTPFELNEISVKSHPLWLIKSHSLFIVNSHPLFVESHALNVNSYALTDVKVF